MANKGKEKGTIWGSESVACKRECLPAVPSVHVTSAFLLEQSLIDTGINNVVIFVFFGHCRVITMG